MVMLSTRSNVMPLSQTPQKTVRCAVKRNAGRTSRNPGFLIEALARGRLQVGSERTVGARDLQRQRRHFDGGFVNAQREAVLEQLPHERRRFVGRRDVVHRRGQVERIRVEPRGPAHDP